MFQCHLDNKMRKPAKKEESEAIENGLWILTLQRFRSPCEFVYFRFDFSKNQGFLEFLISKPEKGTDHFRLLLSPLSWRTFYHFLSK